MKLTRVHIYNIVSADVTKQEAGIMIRLDSGRTLSEFHWTFCREPICQIVPVTGLIHDGRITTGPRSPATLLCLTTATSAIGDALVEEKRARAKRRAVKGCIMKAVEETETTMQV